MHELRGAGLRQAHIEQHFEIQNTPTRSLGVFTPYTTHINVSPASTAVAPQTRPIAPADLPLSITSYSPTMAEIPDPTSPIDTDSLASLPSSLASSTIDDDDRTVDDAEREWKESLQQLELLLSMVVVPYLGKYFGRKCAYWGMSP